jgi:hypothetical protein
MFWPRPFWTPRILPWNFPAHTTACGSHGCEPPRRPRICLRKVPSLAPWLQTKNSLPRTIFAPPGQARGHVRGAYQDLEIAFLDKKTGTTNGFDNRVASFLANLLKIRSSNAPELSGAPKEGEVNYTRQPGEQFQQFLWFALRTGVLDIITR